MFPSFLVTTALVAHVAASTESDQCVYDSSNDNCAIKFLDADITRLYPGGDTRCFVETVDGEPNPFFFQVYNRQTAGVPSKNLHIHLAGGGFCTGLQETCIQGIPSIFQFVWSFFFGQYAFSLVEPEIKPHTGIFSDKSDNPFAEDWMHVRILYCSGDTHVGNRASSKEEGVEYRGVVNTGAALQWTYRNVPHPERLLLTGQSAGSLGMQHWAHSILKHYKTTSNDLKTTTVVLDSYVGVMEPENVGLRHDWGICNGAIFDWPDILTQLCENRLLEPKHAQLFNQQEHPDTPFAFMNQKFDYIQQNSACDKFCTQRSLYKRMQNLLLDLSETSSNAISYFVNGIGHSILDEDTFFTRGTSNIWNPGLSLAEWSRRMVYRTPGETVIQSHCTRWFFPFLDWGCKEELRGNSYRDPF